MPLPERNPEEPKQAFIERCMGDPIMVDDFPDPAQRMAVCQQQARPPASRVLFAAAPQWLEAQPPGEGA